MICNQLRTLFGVLVVEPFLFAQKGLLKGFLQPKNEKKVYKPIINHFSGFFILPLLFTVQSSVPFSFFKVHCRKNRYYTEPLKKASQISDSIQNDQGLKNRIKELTRSSKVLPMCPGAEPLKISSILLSVFSDPGRFLDAFRNVRTLF